MLKPLRMVGEKKTDSSLHEIPSQELGVSKKSDRERAFMNIAGMTAHEYQRMESQLDKNDFRDFLKKNLQKTSDDHSP